MSVELVGSALSRALGLSDKQIKLLIRVGWVLTVSNALIWVTGLYALIGLGHAPYASASEVSEQRLAVREIRVQLIEERILETRIKQCKAWAENNEFAKQYYWEKLNTLMSQYYELKQQNYAIPECREII